MTDKYQLMEKAKKLASEYESKYMGCAHSTFAAIADTLEIYDEKIFKALIGLTGGTGDMTFGTCGGLVGATAAIGVIFGVNRDKLTQEVVSQITALTAKVGKKFIDTYGSYLCREIHKKIYGETFNLRDPEELQRFLSRPDIWKCGEVCGNAAAWAIEAILDAKSSGKNSTI